MGVQEDKLNASQQLVLAVKKASSIPGCAKKNPHLPLNKGEATSGSRPELLSAKDESPESSKGPGDSSTSVLGDTPTCTTVGPCVPDCALCRWGWSDSLQRSLPTAIVLCFHSSKILNLFLSVITFFLFLNKYQIIKASVAYCFSIFTNWITASPESAPDCF